MSYLTVKEPPYVVKKLSNLGFMLTPRELSRLVGLPMTEIVYGEYSEVPFAYTR